MDKHDKSIWGCPLITTRFEGREQMKQAQDEASKHFSASTDIYQDKYLDIHDVHDAKLLKDLSHKGHDDNGWLVREIDFNKKSVLEYRPSEVRSLLQAEMGFFILNKLGLDVRDSYIFYGPSLHEHEGCMKRADCFWEYMGDTSGDSKSTGKGVVEIATTSSSEPSLYGKVEWWLESFGEEFGTVVTVKCLNDRFKVEGWHNGNLGKASVIPYHQGSIEVNLKNSESDTDLLQGAPFKLRTSPVHEIGVGLNEMIYLSDRIELLRGARGGR